MVSEAGTPCFPQVQTFFLCTYYSWPMLVLVLSHGIESLWPHFGRHMLITTVTWEAHNGTLHVNLFS